MLKYTHHVRHTYSGYSAAFGRLRVEILVKWYTYRNPPSAAFGRLRVEMVLSESTTALIDSAAFGRLRVEILSGGTTNPASTLSRLRAAAC